MRIAHHLAGYKDLVQRSEPFLHEEAHRDTALYELAHNHEHQDLSDGSLREESNDDVIQLLALKILQLKLSARPYLQGPLPILLGRLY